MRDCIKCGSDDLTLGSKYYCRDCRKAQDAEYYATHKIEKRNKINTDRKRFCEWLDSLKDGPCSDCENNFPSFVLDWDHRPGEIKIFSLGSIRSSTRSKQVILEEIAKCDLVCANCHRVRTYQRQLSSNG